jgi:hypothetical protein
MRTAVVGVSVVGVLVNGLGEVLHPEAVRLLQHTNPPGRELLVDRSLPSDDTARVRR